MPTRLLYHNFLFWASVRYNCYSSQVTIDKGKTLGIKALAINENLTKTGDREVFFELNGQLRSVFIKDKEAIKVTYTLLMIISFISLLKTPSPF